MNCCKTGWFLFVHLTVLNLSCVCVCGRCVAFGCILCSTVCVSSHKFYATNNHVSDEASSDTRRTLAWLDFAYQTKIFGVYFVIRICVYLYLFYFNNNNNINMYAIFTLNLWCQPFFHYTTANKCTYAHTHTQRRRHYLYWDWLDCTFLPIFATHPHSHWLSFVQINFACCSVRIRFQCSMFNISFCFPLSISLRHPLTKSSWLPLPLSRSLCLCVCVLILLTLCLGYLISSAHTPKPLKCIKIRVRRRRYGKM